MKLLKGFFICLMFVLGTGLAFASGNNFSQAVDSNVIVAAITPIVVWAATWVVTTLWSKIPPMLIMLAVTLISWGYTQLSGVFEAGDTSYVLQILAGVGAVFLNEILKQSGVRSSVSKANL